LQRKTKGLQRNIKDLQSKTKDLLWENNGFAKANDKLTLENKRFW
jgi:hypothetical protein